MAHTVICRACLNRENPEKCTSISPDHESSETSHILEKLSFCIPELDLFLVKDPVICNACIKLLKYAYRFKTKCLKNEENFLRYLSRYSLQTKVDLKYFCQNVPPNDSKNHKNHQSTVPQVPALVQVKQVGEDFPLNNNTQSTPKKQQTLIKPNLNTTFPYKKRKSSVLIRYNSENCAGCKNRIKDARYHAKTISEDYTCGHCDKSYKDIQSLRKHMYGQHFKRAECNVCNKKMRDKSMLEVHMRTHTGVKPYECPVCGKKFVQNYTLIQHMRIHSKERDNRNKCDQCGKVLSSYYNLKIHKLSHTNSKPKCINCGKWFYTQSALDRHFFECNMNIKQELEDEIFEESKPEFVFVKEEAENENGSEFVMDEIETYLDENMEPVKEDPPNLHESNYLLQEITNEDSLFENDEEIDILC